MSIDKDRIMNTDPDLLNHHERSLQDKWIAQRVKNRTSNPLTFPDATNTFAKHGTTQAVIAQESAAEAERAGEERHASNQARWRNQSDAPRIASGLKLDPAAAAARDTVKKAQSDREIELPTRSVLEAVMGRYLDIDPLGQMMVICEPNLKSWMNRIIWQLMEGTPLSTELVGGCHRWLLENGWLELAPNEVYDPQLRAVIRPRGEAGLRPAPRGIYPAYIHRTNEVNQKLAALEAGMARWVEEWKTGHQKPFAEVEADYKRTLKPRKATDPEYGGV